jgi:hypothetical protein
MVTPYPDLEERAPLDAYLDQGPDSARAANSLPPLTPTIVQAQTTSPTTRPLATPPLTTTTTPALVPTWTHSHTLPRHLALS